MKNDIQFDFVRDNHFTELRDAEILREKLQTLEQVSQFVGDYFSKEWVQKNVLYLDDEDIEKIDQQNAKNDPDANDQEQPQQGDDNE